MAKTAIKITGLKELGKAMQSLSDDMRNRVGRAAVNAGAQVVKKKAIALAPEDTGLLKRSIIVKRLPKNETRLTQEYIVGVKKAKKSELGGKNDPYYWRFSEFETKGKPHKPFLGPALEKSKNDASEKIKERLKQRIDKANKK